MGLSPGENPASYRDREIVRGLLPTYEAALKAEILGAPTGNAASIYETMAWHTQRAETAETRSQGSP
jgi:hypothetical protein